MVGCVISAILQCELVWKSRRGKRVIRRGVEVNGCRRVKSAGSEEVTGRSERRGAAKEAIVAEERLGSDNEEEVGQ